MGIRKYEWFDWNARRQAFLREQRGRLKTVDIATKLGTTVGSVVRAARRMDLPRLPNRIKGTDGDGETQAHDND